MPATTTATQFPILTATLNHDGLKTSGLMLAILGCIAGVVVTDPAIAELCVTSDNYVLARHEDEIGMETFVGTADDLDRNLNGVCDLFGIYGKERTAILNAVVRW